MNRETWYELYSSRADADDWFRISSATYDSLEAARKNLDGYSHRGFARGFDFKIIRVTRIEEEAELITQPALLDWFNLGKLLRESALDAFTDDLLSVDDAYFFLLENPECFGRSNGWPPNMPARPPMELTRGYHSSDPAHSNAEMAQ